MTTTTRKGETHFSREVSLVIQTTKQQAPDNFLIHLGLYIDKIEK